MAKMYLTQQRVDRLKPKKANLDVRDTELTGFGIRIMPSGARRYFIHSQHEGRRLWKTIDDAGAVTVAQARQRARTMLAAYRNGDPADPGIEKDALFETVAEDVLAHYERLWKPDTLTANRIYLRKQILPFFAGRMISAITLQDVAAWFRSLRLKPAAANRSHRSFPSSCRRPRPGATGRRTATPVSVSDATARPDAPGPRLLTVYVDGLEFSSVYAPSKLEYPTGTKVEWFESLSEHLTATRPESGRRVMCGDFNVVPEDRYGPRGFVRGSDNYHPDVQARFGTMLKEAGLVDHYAAPPSSWSDRFMYEGREGWVKFSRLEYVLGTRNMVALNPVVRFDINHAIVRNPNFYRVRAPIIADFDV